jgi:hypothetical protein
VSKLFGQRADFSAIPMNACERSSLNDNRQSQRRMLGELKGCH